MRPSLGRKRLVHVVPRLGLGTILYSLTELPRLLPGYAHMLLHETPVAEADVYSMMVLQAAGFEVAQHDCVHIPLLDSIDADAAILHDVTGHVGLGTCMPSIYWAYRHCDLGTECLRYVACSVHRQQRMKVCHGLIVPMVNTRPLLQTAGAGGPFTVAVVHDNADDPYPYDIVNAVIADLPQDIAVMAVKPPDIAALKRRELLTLYPHMQNMAQTMLAHADVVICADSEPGFGYHCVEAMALGKSVLCRNSGFYKDDLRHGIDVITFEDPAKIGSAVRWVIKHPLEAAGIAANGKLWAGYHDSGIAIGPLKDMLRNIGA